MNENDLQILVEQISLKSFHRPFSHKVKINKRMRTTGGRYFLQDHHIEVNEHFLDEKYHEDLIGIIKHELTHYHLHLAGKGYRHRDADFKNLLKQVGGSRYTPDIGLRRRPKIKYLYQCQDCHLLYPRVRRIDTRRYRCGKCRGPLNLIEKSY